MVRYMDNERHLHFVDTAVASFVGAMAARNYNTQTQKVEIELSESDIAVIKSFANDALRETDMYWKDEDKD